MFSSNQIARAMGLFFFRVVASVATVIVFTVATVCQDVPPISPQLVAVETGAYIIPMDNANQGLVAPFNLKAYGLANALLQNNIPLVWAIRSGKSKDDIDFSASAKRIVPSAVASATVDFAGGPFIVQKANAAAALPIINAWGNNVAVYEVTADTVVDARYFLRFKPFIFVGSNTAAVHTNILNFALIPNYTVGADTTINASTCASLVTQAHTNSAAAVVGIKSFVQSGGNLATQCLAANTYENDVNGRFQSTLGFAISNVSTVFTYPNGDMPYSQFIGELEPAPGGSEQDWMLAPGSVFQNNSYFIAQNSGAHTDKFAAVASKLYPGVGGMMSVLGGHSYGAGGSALGDINGQRILLNAVFVPPTRPLACNIYFAPLAANVTLSGDVRTPSGRPVSGVSVSLFNANTNQHLYSTTNNDGYFAFSDLTVGSLYVIRFEKRGYTFANSGDFVNLTDNLDMSFVGVPVKTDPPAGRVPLEPGPQKDPRRTRIEKIGRTYLRGR